MAKTNKIKICAVVFSSNRPEYLRRTLSAQRLLNFSDCDVHRVLIDDYPLHRDDLHILELAGMFNYTEVRLHKRNESLGATWTEFWDLLRHRDYDYIWHSEDDVEVLEPVKISTLVGILQSNPSLSQVVLRRQAWYPHETDPRALDTDTIYSGGLRCEIEIPRSHYFSPMASLYAIERARFDYQEWFKAHYPKDQYHNTNLNEGLVGKALLESSGLVSGLLKNSHGGPLVHHIGEYQQGRILLPHEAGAIHITRDPSVRYSSRRDVVWQGDPL